MPQWVSRMNPEKNSVEDTRKVSRCARCTRVESLMGHQEVMRISRNGKC